MTIHAADAARSPAACPEGADATDRLVNAYEKLMRLPLKSLDAGAFGRIRDQEEAAGAEAVRHAQRRIGWNAWLLKVLAPTA